MAESPMRLPGNWTQNPGNNGYQMSAIGRLAGPVANSHGGCWWSDQSNTAYAETHKALLAAGVEARGQDSLAAAIQEQRESDRSATDTT